MFEELLAWDGVEEHLALRSSSGLMALHGGLEDGTAEIAIAVAAAADASLYAVVQPDDLAWHVPSVRHDPSVSPRLTAFLDHVSTVVSVHGFGRPGLEHTVLVGGRNRRLAARLATALASIHGIDAIDDVERMPTGLRGMHAANPVNRVDGGGVQLELGPDVRKPRYRRALVAILADAVSH
ncbi:MAG: hypothetical protein HKN07_12960 [Acidimicrobiia bacterium]|nr:hypothetical protein [Acidimicrobiia bacterium]